MNKKMKYCPFCGSKKVGCYESWTHWACQCDRCGATMVKRGSKEEAIEAWNARAERTCKFLSEGDSFMKVLTCSVCGDSFSEFADCADEYNYCPNCGARVVR